jgi:integrase
MINHGGDPKLIQTQLGHSSISITYDIYGHLFPDRLDELAARLDRLIDQSERKRDRGQNLGLSM